jgi:zinc protease
MHARVVLLAFTAILAALLSSPAVAEPKKITTVEGITEYQLDNGLKVLLIPDDSRPTITANLTVLVGSRHEGYGESGMAHLLEHMLFKGTPTFPTVDKELRDRGAQANGTTWFDRTNYYETVSATPDNLDWAIRFEADRLVNCFVRREDLFSEMTVVRNEFEQGENSPANLLNNRVMATAYEWHNYGKTTIGNRSDIERVPIENLQDFYRRYYQPDNAVFILGGKFEEAEALKLIQKYFGPIPRPTRKLNNTYTEEPPQDGERLVTLRRVGDVGIVEAVYHIPAGSHEDMAALDMLSDVLSEQPSGRLYKALVEPKKASRATASVYNLHDPGVFDVTIEVRRENSLDEARDICFATIQDVITKGVTVEEVQRAKQNFINNRRAAAQNTQRLTISLSDWIGMGDWRLYFLYRDMVEKVTPADLQRVAAKYLVASNRTLGYFIPAEKTDLVTIPATPQVTSLVTDYKGRPPVAAVAEFDYSYANVEAKTRRIKLADNVKAALLSKPTRDERVQLSLTLRYGNAENLKPFREAASFLPSLMTRGTKRLTFQQLRDEMTKLDVEIRGSGGSGGRFGSPGAATFTLRGRKDSLAPALDLLKQILREPALEASELEIMKQPRIAALEQNRTDPRALASNLLWRTIAPYPSDDVRAELTPEEEIAATKAVTIEQVRELYRDFLGAAAGELTVVGDFDVEATQKQLNEMLANWKPAKPYARIEQTAFLNVPGARHAIPTPDKASAQYDAAFSIPLSDRDADHAALILGNFVLGGGDLASRLGERVRSKDGLSYGVSSYYIGGVEDKVGRLAITAICNPGNIGKVESAIREEFDRLLKDGIPAQEFELARQGILQARKRQQNDDGYIAGRLGRSLRVDGTLAYDASIDEKFAKITADEVLSALKKHFDPKRLVVVVAGDFAQANAN